MASVLARLTKYMLDKLELKPAPGEVLPIEHFPSTDSELAAVSRGGALYLVGSGVDGALWLLAVLEAPECAGIKIGDKRKPGWYAPPNTTPVTDISKLRRKLGVTKDLAVSLEYPLEIKPAAEAALRELLGDSDAPVLGIVEEAAPRPVPVVTGPPLARAAALLDASHVAPAIDAMLEAWRDSRAPEIADLIDRATRALPLHDRPLLTKRYDSEKEANAAWMEAFEADRAAAMPQLLQNMLVGGDWRGTLLHKRLERLAALPADPRITRRIAELAPLTSRYNWVGSLVKIFETARDVRTCEYLVEVADDAFPPPAPKLYAFARDPSRSFKRWPLELTDAQRARAGAITAALDRLEQTQRTERDLVDAIADHPDDDGARLVYADWLLERGHPRGEYLSLAVQQDRGKISAASARRLAVLVEIPFLFGALDDIASARLRKRDRGIDRTLDVSLSTSLAWASAATHPLIRALETVNLIGNLRPTRTHGMAAFIRAAPKLHTIGNVASREANVLRPLLDGQFRHAGDKLTRVGRRR